MASDEIELLTGRMAKMDQVRAHFEYLFNAEESGDNFPVDLEAVFPLAYGTKRDAKRALVNSKDFFEGIDYRIITFEDSAKRPQGGGTQPEKIVLSIQCFEWFIARKNRDVFEVYRECRVKLTEMARAKREIPYHLRRYIANMDQVPMGHFSILSELAGRLFAPLEKEGHTIREDMLPDGSVGKLFCGWLRKVKSLDPTAFPNYQHSYEDGRVVQARAYPLWLLPDFVEFFHATWMTERAKDYFADRDDTVLPYIQKMIDKATDQKGDGGLPQS